MSLLTLTVPALLYLLPVACGIFNNGAGVVEHLGSLLADDEGDWIHTWYQPDPTHPKRGDLYKMECSLSKSSTKQYIVKLYYKDILLQKLIVTRFDDELLKSVTVYKRDKRGRHKIQYKMVEGCKVRMYVTVTEDQQITTYDKRCQSWVLARMSNAAGIGWKWDQNSLYGKSASGAVRKTGLLDRKDEGELLHIWKSKREGYKMSVRRVREGNSFTYLATVHYQEAALDTVEVASLGEGLTRSITVLSIKDTTHILQYQKVNNQCQGLQINLKKMASAKAILHYKNMVYKRAPRRCSTKIMLKVSIVVRKIFMLPDPLVSWVW